MIYLINEKVDYIIRKLNDHGFEANIVGGCVRDILLMHHPSDIDINTDATPSQVTEVFKDHKIFKTGLKHGTVSLLLDGESFEITTYRIDGKYSDYRHPETVEFSSDIKNDLSRRDFTINALAYNSKDGLIDFYNGYDDLNNKIIRCVGNPYTRFKEDALRILRAIRFASTLGFRIEEETQKAIFETKDLLLNISVERIYIELIKILTGKYVSEALLPYKEIIEIIIPEYKDVARYKYVESLNYLSREKEDKSIILTLFILPLENYKNILTRLKVDNKTFNEVSFLIDHYYYFIEADKTATRFNLKEMGQEMFIKLLKVQYFSEHIDKSYYNLCISAFEYIDENKLPYQLKDLAVDGNDISKFGFKGKEIAVQLDKILSLIIKNKLNNTKDNIYKYLETKRNRLS
ncbi:MAG: CCA tRNA nucleotidyltransferase [Erysipelotrichaceae bacterium]